MRQEEKTTQTLDVDAFHTIDMAHIISPAPPWPPSPWPGIGIGMPSCSPPPPPWWCSMS